MENIILTIFISSLVILGLLLLLSFWALYCNNKTLEQRNRIIDIASIHPDCLKLYGNVDYNKHVICLMLFRNPLPLYGCYIANEYKRLHSR